MDKGHIANAALTILTLAGLAAVMPTAAPASPANWPESEALCDIPWDELDASLGS